MPTTAPLDAEFSLRVLLTLALIFAASMGMFWMLIRRWTTRRQWIALADWARGNRFEILPLEKLQIPAPLAQIRSMELRTRQALGADRRLLLRLQSDITPASRAEHQKAHWHVLSQEIEASWPATALRPTANTVSMIDGLPLTSYPSLSGERFMIFGSDSLAARALAKSSVGALLPPDVGLLLAERYLILDFSQRPFDIITFERMLALLDQIVAHLPSPPSRRQ